MEAARLALIRSLDGEDLLAVGALSLAGLLQDRCKTTPGHARRDVAAARATAPDPVPGRGVDDERGTLVGLGAALADGRVSREHVDVAVKTMKIPRAMRRAAATTVDEFFVDVSVKCPPRACERLAAEILDRLDPTRTDPCFDPDAFARRTLDVVVDSTGMVIVRGQLDPMTGAQLKAAIDHYAVPDPAHRDQDGLVGLAGAGTRGGEPPRVVVHVTTDQLTALAAGRTLGEQTAAGQAWCEQLGHLAPDTLTRFGCSAVFERVLLAPNGAVLNLGRTVRLATAAQRRALAARDKGCIIPGCTRPANQTDAHHVNGWATGALTDIAELALLCGPHHNAVHAGTYQIIIRDGISWVRAHSRVHPNQPLRRNDIHHDTHAHARATAHQIRLDLGLDPPAGTG